MIRLWWVFFCLLLLQLCAASAATVLIYHDTTVPMHRFAVQEIRAALPKSEVVEERTLTDLLEQQNDPDERNNKIVLATKSSNPNVLALLANETNDTNDISSLGTQAFVIRSTSNNKHWWVIGGDDRGVLYGGLELAETIQFSSDTIDNIIIQNKNETPYLLERGIKFNIPMDGKRSPTYFSSTSGDSHKVAVAAVWELEFWTTWFDEMARHRFNVLTLWTNHPFTSMIQLADYPDVILEDVYAQDGSLIQTMTIGEKIDFWKKVMEYGSNRGFDIYFVTWNIFTYGATGKYGITNDPGNTNTQTYMKACMTKFLETYPHLTGFGVTAGEKMGDIEDTDKTQWLYDTYGQGMRNYAVAHPERNLVFIHRTHQVAPSDILGLFSNLASLPNVRLDVSAKWSQAHMHAAPVPTFFDRLPGQLDAADAEIKTWLECRNDDFYFLTWADPQFARAYINGFGWTAGGKDRYVRGPLFGADGWVWTREFVSKDPFFSNGTTLSIQKAWYMYKLWGRLSYNPNTPDAVFRQHLVSTQYL